MRVKYHGRSHERSFELADLAKARGSEEKVESGTIVQFDVSNNWTAEVPDEDAKWLIATDAFREATQEDLEIPDMGRVGTIPHTAGSASLPERGSLEPAEGNELTDPSGDDSTDHIETSPGAVSEGVGTSGKPKSRSTARR